VLLSYWIIEISILHISSSIRRNQGHRDGAFLQEYTIFASLSGKAEAIKKPCPDKPGQGFLFLTGL